MRTESRVPLMAALAAVTLLDTSCDMQCGDSECLFSDEEWAIVESLTPLPDPIPDPTNKYATDEAAAALGQKLFFENRYSGTLKIEGTPENGGLGDVGETGRVACASCHIPDAWFVDTRSLPGNVSLGTRYTTRNAPTLINVSFYNFHGWGGKQDSLWTQASRSPESGSNTAGDRCGYAHMLYNYYRAEYNAVFDDPLPEALSPTAPDADRFPPACKPNSSDGAWEAMTAADQRAVNLIMANQGKAVAAYEFKLISRDAPFDRYVGGDAEAISASAKRGLQLFIGKAACVDCHNTPFFSDNDFHNIGVPQVGLNVPATDSGRFGGIPSLLSHEFNTSSEFNDGDEDRTEGLAAMEADRGQFRTPGLRLVAMTAPYLHTGALETLREVIEFYNEGGASDGFEGVKHPALVPLGLTDMEVSDLVSFLESLTGDPIPDALIAAPPLPVD